MAPKKKQEKMALGDFLQNQSLGSWADEMDSQPLPSVSARSGYGGDRDGGERRAFTQPSWETARTGSGMGGGFGGGMGDRGASYDRPQYAMREQLPLPSKPPYTAHLGNLTYDVTQVDVEEFLKGCKVTSVRIVEDKVDHKPKGFGYVEFASLEDLKTALTFTEKNFMGRNVKISIAEPPKDRPESTRDFSDWSRKGPLVDPPQSSRQNSRGFSRNFETASDAGSERGGSRRPGFFEGDGKVRDFSNWERRGPLSPAPGQGPPVRDGGRLREGAPPLERRQSPAWGEGRSDAGSRPPRREFDAARPPVERVPTAAEMDTQWRSKMRADPSPAPTPDVSVPSSPQAPKERPRLALQKRTVSTAEPDAAAASGTDAKASPFGAARPIDTAARDREVEEKRLASIKEKQEAAEKAKEEKAKQEAAAREARAERADRGQAQEDDTVKSPTTETAKPRRTSRQQNGTKPAPKENGEATSPNQPKPSFSILRRDTDGEDGDEAVAEEHEQAEEGANGNVTHPNPTVAGGPAEESTPQLPENGTTEGIDADGWETVPAKTKNSRRGGPGRPIAS